MVGRSKATGCFKSCPQSFATWTSRLIFSSISHFFSLKLYQRSDTRSSKRSVRKLFLTLKYAWETQVTRATLTNLSLVKWSLLYLKLNNGVFLTQTPFKELFQPPSLHFESGWSSVQARALLTKWRWLLKCRPKLKTISKMFSNLNGSRRSGNQFWKVLMTSVQSATSTSIRRTATATTLNAGTTSWRRSVFTGSQR